MEEYFFRIKLQIFAEGEKTEDATPKRREEARKKGQVAKSAELPQIATLLVGVISLKFFIKTSYRVLANEFSATFREMGDYTFSIEILREMMIRYSIAFFLVVGPVLAGVLIAGLFSNYLQVGFLFTLEPIKPSFNKINPINGLKNMFSLKKIVELVKTLIKLTVIGFYSWTVLKRNTINFMNIPDYGFMESFIMIFNIGYGILLNIAVVLFIIAVIDYVYQRYEYNKSLKMSKHEIKEEFKQSEGNPQIKQRMRQMQREMVRKRMIQDVPKATVVITNPTHLSIAIQYESGMLAPIVLAKGADGIAFRIREIAKENNVPIVENKPLARALYQMVEPGDEIPEEYYKAVAEVLQFVFTKYK